MSFYATTALFPLLSLPRQSDMTKCYQPRRPTSTNTAPYFGDMFDIPLFRPPPPYPVAGGLVALANEMLGFERVANITGAETIVPQMDRCFTRQFNWLPKAFKGFFGFATVLFIVQHNWIWLNLPVELLGHIVALPIGIKEIEIYDVVMLWETVVDHLANGGILGFDLFSFLFVWLMFDTIYLYL